MTIIRGDIIYTAEKEKYNVCDDGYLIIEKGEILGVYDKLPEKYLEEEIIDRRGKLIIPSFTDLHLHAPQYANRGLGTDKELMEWLSTYTFPEEEKFSDIVYAEKIWKRLINDLWKCGSLRSVVFSSIHEEATDKLLEMFIESGLSAYVGKVNMDRNTNETYWEPVEKGMKSTEKLIRKYEDKSGKVKTIITPRFAITCCSESLMEQGKLSEKYEIPVQTHLNESFGEIDFTMSLFPEYKNYSDIYEKHNLFGRREAAIMAHCIHNTEEEVELMKQNRIYPVHCPESNANLISGIMDVRRLMDEGLPVCIASDISGGHSLFMPRQLVLAVQLSKMKARFENNLSKVVKNSEAFYMSTKNPGSFFGKIGSFEEGYKGDFLVIDVDDISDMKELTTVEKFEKWLYIGSENDIVERYLEGKKIEKPYPDIK